MTIDRIHGAMSEMQSRRREDARRELRELCERVGALKPGEAPNAADTAALLVLTKHGRGEAGEAGSGPMSPIELADLLGMPAAIRGARDRETAAQTALDGMPDPEVMAAEVGAIDQRIMELLGPLHARKAELLTKLGEHNAMGTQVGLAREARVSAEMRFDRLLAGVKVNTDW